MRGNLENKVEEEKSSWENFWKEFPFIIIYAWIISVAISNRLGCEPYEVVKKEPIEKNVIGNKIPEKFYNIGGKRVYLEIDGKPVEEY